MTPYQEKVVGALLEEKYKGVQSDSFHTDIKRILEGEPYEYVLGYIDFLGAHIDLSLRPMIPRPESAFWVERAIAELKVKQKILERPLRLAEVFAGAGAIGVALSKHFPNAHVDISELDPRLKEQIEISLEKNGIDLDHVHVTTASALEGLNGTYDAIFAVPPYIPYEALPELDQEMIDYEPHLAFFAHNNGHEYHQILIDAAYDFLNEGGTLYMEADIDHGEWIQKHVQGTLWKKLEFWPDPYGATPNVVLRK